MTVWPWSTMDHICPVQLRVFSVACYHSLARHATAKAGRSAHRGKTQTCETILWLSSDLVRDQSERYKVQLKYIYLYLCTASQPKSF